MKSTTGGKGPVIVCFHETYRRPYILSWGARFAHENRVGLHVLLYGGHIDEPTGRGHVTVGELSMAEVQLRFPDINVTHSALAAPDSSDLVALAQELDAFALVLPPILLQDTADSGILDDLAHHSSCPLLVMPEEWVPRPGRPIVACVELGAADATLDWAFGYAFERGIDVVGQVVESVPAEEPPTEANGTWWKFWRKPTPVPVCELSVAHEAVVAAGGRGRPGVGFSTRRCGRSLSEALAWPQDEASMVVAPYELLENLPRPDAEERGLTPYLVQLAHPVALIPQPPA